MAATVFSTTYYRGVNSVTKLRFVQPSRSRKRGWLAGIVEDSASTRARISKFEFPVEYSLARASSDCKTRTGCPVTKGTAGRIAHLLSRECDFEDAGKIFFSVGSSLRNRV